MVFVMNLCCEWVKGLKIMAFNNHTNNRAECLNQKLKSVIKSNCSFLQFVDHLLQALTSLNIEHDHQALEIISKCPIIVFKEGSIEHKYQKLLTPFALQFVLKEIKYGRHRRTAAHKDCNCNFKTQFELPCWHIIAYCSRNDISLFDEHLCSRRWTLDYYRRSHRARP